MRWPLHILLVACLFPAAASLSVRRESSLVAQKPKNAPRPTPGRYPWESLPNTVRHVIASASSGAIAVTVLAPLEVVRVNLLVNPDVSLRTVVDSLKGARFRGNTADVISGAAKLGITMPAYYFFKDIASNIASKLDPSRGEDAPVPTWGLFAAGALAGCTATAILFPLEVARTRMAMECNIDSVYSCLETIWNAEGIRALYQGLTTSLSGVIPFNAIKLTSYDTLRRQAILAFGVTRTTSLPTVVTAAIGASAGVAAATSCFPLEVVRRRQMMGEYTGLGTIPAIGALVKAEGLKTLYRGVYVNMAKVALSNAIGFVLYELAKDALCVDGRMPPWEKAALIRNRLGQQQPGGSAGSKSRSRQQAGARG